VFIAVKKAQDVIGISIMESRERRST